MKKLWSKLGHWRGRDGFDADLEEEMRVHMEMKAEEYEAEGMTREAARARARKEFGSMARLQEETRDVWRMRWLEELVSDLKYALRAMGRTPGYALAAIFSLALGTGANTAMFSLTSEFLMSEPSVGGAKSLAILRVNGASHSAQREWRFLKDAKVFDGLAGMKESEVNWRQGDETYKLAGIRVTENFFDVARMPVWLGRGLEAGEKDAVVLNYSFWRQRLGAREEMVGRTLVLDGRPYRIVGVLPKEHRTLVGFGYTPDMYAPLTDDRDAVKMLGRIPAGMARPAALEKLHAACDELDKVYPPAGGEPRRKDTVLEGVTSVDRLQGRKMVTVAAFFGMLLTVSGLVLLVSCVNAASLSLARAESRRQELAIRVAMGASRGRVMRQLLAESLALAVAGTALGVGLTAALGRWASTLALPLPVPVRLDMHVDWRLFGYAALVAVGSALVSGWIPAFAATRRDVQPGLKQGERSAGSERRRMRSVLVAAQLGVTTVLISTALLFLRNLGQASETDPGFDVTHTTWAAMRLVPERYAENERRVGVAERALERVKNVAGVETAALADVVPLNDSMTIGTMMKTDLDAKGKQVRAQINRVSPEYFRTMGIGLKAGRDFTEADRVGASSVMIVNEAMAERLFGAQSPVGHTVGWEFAGGRKVFEVVGVARDSKYFTLGEEKTAAFYTPWRQEAEHGVNLHVLARSDRAPEGLVRELRAALLEVDGTAAVEVRPMRNALALAFLPSKAGAYLLGSMGALGLLLAALGLYGVLSYGVSRRVREIGLRMAMGASPWRVARLVFGQSLALAGSGAAVGMAVALLVTQPLAMFLVPGVKPGDPLVYAGVGALLATVAGAATAGPLWRALRVDPARALRQE
ncbi:MAG: ABC transporter permease [Acidobacteria bacterium]|nr:ABC transporter permease [Acidobacteriota bacterium]